MSKTQFSKNYELGDKAIRKISGKLNVTETEIVENYVYCGSDSDTDYFNLFFDMNPPIQPDHKSECICEHKIQNNCYITDKRNKRNSIIVVGNCCMKRFLPYSGRTCSVCSSAHKNRKDNYCNDCRNNLLTREVWFSVPFADRKKAKLMGAKFNPKCKVWYANTLSVEFQMKQSWPVIESKSAQWHRIWEKVIKSAKLQCPDFELEQKIVEIPFKVPYEDREKAKQFGARWEPNKKYWYAATEDIANFMKQHWQLKT